MTQAPPSFAERLAADGQALLRDRLDTVQINIGRRCNQACRHCHVGASPTRTEAMSDADLEAVLQLLERSGAQTLDITGGAPELHPRFRWLVAEARARGVHVMDRCNLTILTEPGHEDLADFLADHEVEVIASLPCYLEDNVDRQRGAGVYGRSIEGLRRLNARGYGRGERVLNLVYNPLGPSLPPPQAGLEADYKRELDARFGVVFDGLFTITNMPIDRFAADLRRQGALDDYVRMLAASHNPANLAQVMCRALISIGWDGRVYDCDFHHMLGLALADDGAPLHVRSLVAEDVVGRPIVLRDHCYGCTAGAGSSCGGALR